MKADAVGWFVAGVMAIGFLFLAIRVVAWVLLLPIDRTRFERDDDD